MSRSRKSFQQRCPMASALDVVGERWTLLLLRELLGGPARFNDLLEGLPGIARNLLTLRLRRLEDDGLLERIAVEGTTRYSLTPLGEGARPALESLGFWGARLPRLAEPVHDRSLRAVAMALQAILVHAGRPLPEIPLRVALAVDGHTLVLGLGPRPTAAVQTVPADVVRVRAARATLADYLEGRPVDPDDLPGVQGDSPERQALLVALGIASA